MGCSSSALKKIPPRWLADFKELRITDSDVEKCFKVYRKIDADGSGAVSIEEMLIYLEIEPTAFSRRVFSIFDLNKSGKVDFREFVLSMWNYCTLSNATLGKALSMPTQWLNSLSSLLHILVVSLP